MKLMINTATTSKGGSVQVAKSFIEECKKFKENFYFVILSQSLSAHIRTESYPDNFVFYKMNYRPATRIFSFRSASRLFKKLEREIKPDAVFTTSGPAYWKPRSPHLLGYNLPHYIYPDSPFFHHSGFFVRVKWFIRGMILRYFFSREGTAYVVQTPDVKKRLGLWLGKEKRIHLVSNTYSEIYTNFQLTSGKLPKRAKNDESFRLLFLSAYYKHKNFELIRGIIDKMSLYQKKKYFFIVTLKRDEYLKVFGKKYRGNIINVGIVPPGDCPSLYSECDAMFLPSLLECFSASYPEAMRMKKPVLTSDLDFARSVCKDAAVYFDPLNPEDALLKIENLYADKELQARLIQSGEERLKHFPSAEKRAFKYLQICSQMSRDY